MDEYSDEVKLVRLRRLPSKTDYGPRKTPERERVHHPKVEKIAVRISCSPYLTRPDKGYTPKSLDPNKVIENLSHTKDKQRAKRYISDYKRSLRNVLCYEQSYNIPKYKQDPLRMTRKSNRLYDIDHNLNTEFTNTAPIDDAVEDHRPKLSRNPHSLAELGERISVADLQHIRHMFCKTGENQGTFHRLSRPKSAEAALKYRSNIVIAISQMSLKKFSSSNLNSAQDVLFRTNGPSSRDNQDCMTSPLAKKLLSSPLKSSTMKRPQSE